MKKLLLSLLVLFIAVGCAQTQVKNEVESEREQIVEVENREQMIQKMRSILNNSEKLSMDQKEKFMSMHEQMIEDVAKINENMRKEKVVLYQAMFNQDYNSDKVRLLRKNMKKLHQAKFDIMMDALDQSKDILGVVDPEIYERINDNFGRF